MSGKNKLTILFCLCLFSVFTVRGANKYGLFIGINDYPAPMSKLGGCVNDARKWRNLAKNDFGVSESNSDILLDAQATREGIISTIKKYQSLVSAGDVFIMAYSGHGTLFPDSRSEQLDEAENIQMPSIKLPPDKYDSAICPFDSRQTTSGKPWKNLILDDELYELFSGMMAKGAAVYFISDSCHSGSMARGLGGKTLNFSPDSTSTRRFSPPLKALDISSFSQLSTPRTQQTIRQRELSSNLLLILAGSQDDQFSLDVSTSGGRHGLFTATFNEQYEKLKGAGNQATLASVMDKTRPFVEDYSMNVPPDPGEKIIPQIPRFDARFFCGTLDIPLFSFPNCGENAAKNVKVVAKITDQSGNPITGAAMGLLKFGTNTNPHGIRPEDALLLGRSDTNGLYQSNEQKVAAGRYLIKVIKTGFKPFIQEVEITESTQGTAVLTFKLVSE
jgi:hypothetical protein